MREDYVQQFFQGETAGNGHGRGKDDFRAGIAQHVHPHHAVVGIQQHLAKAFAPFILGYEAAGIGHGKLAHADIPPPDLLLREAHAGHFRIGIDDAGNGVIGHLVRYAKDMVHRYFGLSTGGMGQHGESRHVPGGIDSGNRRLHVDIHHDAPGRRYAQVLQPEALQPGPSAHTQEDFVSPFAAALPFRRLEDHLVPFHGHYLAAQVERHALFGILGLQQGRHLVVHGPQDLGQHLDDRDLGPYGVEKAGELHAYYPAADDDQLRGRLVQGQDLPVGHHAVSGLRQAGDGRNHRLGARAEEQFLRFIHGVGRPDGKAAGHRAFDESIGLHDLDAGVAEPHFHAAHEFLHYLFLPLHHRAEIQRSAFHRDAVFVRMPGIIIQFGAVEQCFCGDAAFVQAYAAQLPVFEKDNAEAGFGRFLCGHIASGAAAYDGKLIHSFVLFCGTKIVNYEEFFVTFVRPIYSNYG